MFNKQRHHNAIECLSFVKLASLRKSNVLLYVCIHTAWFTKYRNVHIVTVNGRDRESMCVGVQEFEP